jgi:hypothetical protein
MSEATAEYQEITTTALCVWEDPNDGPSTDHLMRFSCWPVLSPRPSPSPGEAYHHQQQQQILNAKRFLWLAHNAKMSCAAESGDKLKACQNLEACYWYRTIHQKGVGALHQKRVAIMQALSLVLLPPRFDGPIMIMGGGGHAGGEGGVQRAACLFSNLLASLGERPMPGIPASFFPTSAR